MERLTDIRAQWNVKIFDQAPGQFQELALKAFGYQYQCNPIYRAFTDALGITPHLVQSIEQIPFLPISFFKTTRVYCDLTAQTEPPSSIFEAPLMTPSPLPGPLKSTDTPSAQNLSHPLIFESSGTTSTSTSLHQVRDAALYQQSFLQGFMRVFGPANNWCLLALLPSYLERKNSSLVYMAAHLIEQTQHPDSGFYLHQLETLHHTLARLEQQKQPTLLLGVSFALLELGRNYPQPLQYTKLIETGGMKGRGPELTREELHQELQAAFGLPAVLSEYGMTELLSQAWSKQEGLFQAPPWMQVLVREQEDPRSVQRQGSGALNIIDLANIDSCCFIATEDMGQVYPNGDFEVKGRLDHATLRGCALLLS